MTPVEQTIFGEGKGNCFAACVASALDVPLDDVPNFVVLYGAEWPRPTHDWLMERGVTFLSFLDDPYQHPTAREVWPNVPIVATGKSPRGDFLHSVLWMNGKLLHDPHFSKEGLVGPPTSYDMFLIVDAAKFMAWRSSLATHPETAEISCSLCGKKKSEVPWLIFSDENCSGACSECLQLANDLAPDEFKKGMAFGTNRLTPELHAVLEFIVASYDSNGIKSLPTVDVEDAIDEILKWSRAEVPDVAKRCRFADALETRAGMLHRHGIESVLPSERVAEELELSLAMRRESNKVTNYEQHAEAEKWLALIREYHDWQRAKSESQG